MCRAVCRIEMLLQNKPWLTRYKKIRAMSDLPSVECGKFKSKQAFQSGKINLACIATSTLNLIKMMPNAWQRKPLPHACFIII